MNVVKVLGGLGNQLFQYAFGQVLSYCKKEEPLYDISWYDKVRTPPRPYRLNVFDLSIKTGSFSDRRETVREGKEIKNFFQYKNNKNYYGYWQSPLYYNRTLKEKFSNQFHVLNIYKTFQFLELYKKITDCNSVAVHIRRGDYLDNENHLVLPLSYYKGAMDMIRKIKDNPRFFIFSDDPIWCVNYLNSEDSTLVIIDDYLGFELMRNCKHHIIANSTYSWWPAYLNGTGMVIAPSRWSKADNSTFIHKGILLDTWIKINIEENV